MLCISYISVLDIDVTLFDKTPLLNIASNTPQYDYRAYVPWSQRDATYKFGRAGYTGTGEVGNGYDGIEETGVVDSVPVGRGFPAGTHNQFYKNAWKHARLEIRFPQPPTIASVGVFYVDTFYNGTNVSLSTIKISESGM